MTSTPKPAIPDLVTAGIQALAKIAEMPIVDGGTAHAPQELLDRNAVVKQIHVLRDALMGISAEHGKQLTQRAARDESLEVACDALIAISEHDLPPDGDIREFNEEGHKACVSLAYDATATIGNLLHAADQPGNPVPSASSRGPSPA